MRKRTVFACVGCQYTSNRQFNVIRHERRIHSRNKSRICCGEVLSSKAEYYAHCEVYHPNARAHTYISKDKYKITADSVVLNRRPAQQEAVATKKGRRMYNFRVRRKYTGSIGTSRKQRNMNSKLSLKYSLTYSGVDMEDVPLICFLNNQPSADPHKVTVSTDYEENQLEDKIPDIPSLPEPNTENECMSELEHFEFERNFKNDIESTEQADTQNEEQNESEVTLEPTSPISPTALPAKKLILHRFKTSFEHEFKVNLCDSNNNYEEMNITKSSSESVTRLLQTVKHKANKENVSSYEFSVEKELNIKLDRSVTIPMTTKLHRDFLEMIDFESYKIF